MGNDQVASPNSYLCVRWKAQVSHSWRDEGEGNTAHCEQRWGRKRVEVYCQAVGRVGIWAWLRRNLKFQTEFHKRFHKISQEKIF